MMTSLKKLTKVAIAEYEMKSREEWVTQHASQVGCERSLKVERPATVYEVVR